jgi:predicted enzyme related to lactoylglutathione lyase
MQLVYAARAARGVTFTAPPTELHGSRLARFLDSEGAETSVSG